MNPKQWNEMMEYVKKSFKRYVLIHATFLEKNGEPNYIYKAHLDKATELWKVDNNVIFVIVAELHYQEKYRQDIAGLEYLMQRGIPRSSIICLDDLPHPLNKGAHNSTEEIKTFRRIIKDVRAEGISVRPETITNMLHWGRMVVAYRKLLPNVIWHRAPLKFKLSNFMKEGIGYTLAYLFADPLQEGVIF